MTIPSSAIAAIAAINDANLPERADVERASSVRVDGGERATTYAVVDELRDVPCRLSLTKNDEATIAGQEGTTAEYVVVFASGTVIRATDRLVVRGTTRGVAFAVRVRVTGIAAPRGAEAMRKVYATASAVEQPDA